MVFIAQKNILVIKKSQLRVIITCKTFASVVRRAPSPSMVRLVFAPLYTPGKGASTKENLIKNFQKNQITSYFKNRERNVTNKKLICDIGHLFVDVTRYILVLKSVRSSPPWSGTRLSRLKVLP